MAKITFNTEELAALLADAQRAWAADNDVRTYCGAYNEQGLWLVGDAGVYLMHNGKTHVRVDGSIPARMEPPLPSTLTTPIAVVYAKECDPRKGDCWESKRRLFGADDGIELIPRVSAEAWVNALVKLKRKTGEVNITRDAITIVTPLA